jgi:hypothetical protein
MLQATFIILATLQRESESREKWLQYLLRIESLFLGEFVGC